MHELKIRSTFVGNSKFLGNAPSMYLVSRKATDVSSAITLVSKDFTYFLGLSRVATYVVVTLITLMAN